MQTYLISVLRYFRLVQEEKFDELIKSDKIRFIVGFSST